jgi:hypothetical protein
MINLLYPGESQQKQCCSADLSSSVHAANLSETGVPKSVSIQ